MLFLKRKQLKWTKEQSGGQEGLVTLIGISLQTTAVFMSPNNGNLKPVPERLGVGGFRQPPLAENISF